MDARPLIVSLRFDPSTQAWFDALRRAHFPAERNFLPAHLTLFHALPGSAVDEVSAQLAVIARRPAFELHITSLRSLGRGVAYVVVSSELNELHAALAQCWSVHLTRQDRQPFAPHITVQNKVDPMAARRLLETLRREFEPRSGLATGLDLWHYAGGPWECAGGADFSGLATAARTLRTSQR